MSQIKIGKRSQRAIVKYHGLWSYCASSNYVLDLGIRGPARPLLAIPNVLRIPLTEVRPYFRSSTLSSTPAAAFQLNRLSAHECFGKVVDNHI